MHVLVIRLSAMGDVAMTVPVLVEALEQNQDLELTILSKKPFQYFFPVSERLHFEVACILKLWTLKVLTKEF
jgi:ADP-heptose:LPS heptosyltransferase